LQGPSDRGLDLLFVFVPPGFSKDQAGYNFPKPLFAAAPQAQERVRLLVNPAIQTDTGHIVLPPWPKKIGAPPKRVSGGAPIVLQFGVGYAIVRWPHNPSGLPTAINILSI
jgi:hypothetical protein